MKPLHRYLLATASSVALIGSAAAADMPTKARLADPALSWAGPYVGLNLGTAWNNAKFSDLGAVGGTNFAFPAGAGDPFWSPSKAGFTFGGQAGYNWQTGMLVYGVEGDLNWVDNKASATFSPFGVSLTSTSKLEWMATLRGRLGVTFSQFLIYGTGGVATAHFSDAWGVTATGANDFSSNQTRTAWIGGGGIEYMIARNWTARVEALYANFGTTNVSIPAAGTTYVSSFRHTVSTVRGALNWKW